MSRFEGDRESIAAFLSTRTGRSVEHFDPDLEEYPLPDFDELEWVSVDD